mmetsp:Transcript_12866/g.39569  ORF Transcript_12866/g.39569 Transcript_12866/m.39569 type:complete len:424 (-) Transcript_12866:49-1320(-)
MESCALCRLRIDGSRGHLTFAQQPWHAECFRCGKCGDMLAGGQQLVQKDRRPFHERCFRELYGKRCAFCKEFITKQYVKKNGEFLHESCFICCVCGKSLAREQYHEQGGKVYCASDYQQLFCPKCALCGKTIASAYISAKKGNFHPKCFACTSCGASFVNKSYVEHKSGQCYCEPCYENNFNPRCTLCHAVLKGEFRRNVHQEPYCSSHEGSVPNCYSCARIVTEAYRNRYADGRIMCGKCRKTAVVTKKTLELLFKEVIAFFKAEGLDAGTFEAPLRLADQPTLNRLHTRATREFQPSGLTRKCEERAGNRVKSRSIQEVVLLDGLPEEHACAVLAHEYGHIYLFLRGFGELPLRVEEGVCEHFQYLWLRDESSEEAKLRIRRMCENKDKVYGGGFRDCLAASRAIGFKRVLQRVREDRRFP